MAQAAKTSAPLATSNPTNGVLSGNPNAAPGPPAVNRKKAKRRQKQAAAKLAAEQSQAQQTSLSQNSSNHRLSSPSTGIQTVYDDAEYDDQDPLGELDDHQYYEADDPYALTAGSHVANGHYAQQYAMQMGNSKKSKKKRKNKDNHEDLQYDPTTGLAPPPPPPPPPAPAHGMAGNRLWNSSTAEERENIKNFWLSLGEDKRKSLVKIEKEAVLSKMKEQQKHSCSCTVCGRKRTAIEEELETLYDAYYDELEQYNSDCPTCRLYPESAARIIQSICADEYTRGRIQELADDPDEEALEEDFSEDEYSEDEPADPPRGPAADLFQFGASLQVKGGILTVADDLLKNDGRKFIDMMEQLAERRMQREEEAQYNAGLHPPYTHGSHVGHNHPPDDEEYDDEEDDYDSQEEDDFEEEDDDMEQMTEQQRMDEGRRMFQIFAARMFEQRVLSAYKEKVAIERQEALIRELAEDQQASAEKQAKKARDAQKKKNKKQQQKQSKAEEKAKKDAEKAAEESAARAAEEKKQEEQRRRKEEQKKKREAERKAQEEDKKRKEAERKRRQQEEREKQQEAERKAREEKKAKEDAKRKEREERDAQEREVKEKKQLEEKERREREAKAKAEKEAKEKVTGAQTGHPIGVKRPSQPAAIPTLPRQLSSGIQSPQIPVATPALPKAATPGRPRQSSQQGSYGSSPSSPSVGPSTSKSVSPGSVTTHPQRATAPKQILQKPQSQQPPFQNQPPHSGMIPGVPPLGTPGSNTFNGFPPSLNGLPQNHGPFPGVMQRTPTNPGPGFFNPQGPMNGPMRSFSGSMPSGMPPPGMMPPAGRGNLPPPIGAPPGFGDTPPGISTPQFAPGFGTMSGTHSRNASGSYDKPPHDSSQPTGPPTQPIHRPAPIQRPPSTSRHHDSMPGHRQPTAADIANLGTALGSSALLDDDDDPYLPPEPQTRRSSAAPALARTGSQVGYPSTTSAGINNPGFGSMLLSSGPSTAYNGFGPIPPMPGHNNTWRSSPPSASGWPTTAGFSPFGGHGAGPQQTPGAISRPVWVRRSMCAACRSLSVINPSNEGFHQLDDIVAAIESTRPQHEPRLEYDEVLAMCETEGDSTNGGGSFTVRQQAPARPLIRFEEMSGGGRRVGEIGSPLLSDSTPVFGGSPTSAQSAGAGAIGSPATRGSGAIGVGSSAAPGAGRFLPGGPGGLGLSH